MSRDEIIREIPKWHDLIWGIVRKAGFNEDDTEDLTGDIILKALERAHEFDPSRAKLSTWLGSMAKWTAIERRRSVKGRVGKPKPLVLSLSDALEATYLTTEGVAQDRAEQHEMIALFLNSLMTPSERAVGDLLLSECDASEIADRLNLSKSRIHQVIQGLRKRLAA